ncbi:MAG: hypothetical protein MUE56_01635 [Ignavibacteria bacterium]|jgi:hypothetical protein|nr:hypothetical protein [Ignavibacteria bacterium]
MSDIIKNITITVLLSLTFLYQGCDLYDDEYIPPIIPDPETGIYYVGHLKTNGNAVYVKGKVINQVQYAFLADGPAGLQIINVTNGESPVLTYNFQTNGFLREVFIDTIKGRHYAFLSDEIKGLYVLDVTNPSNPAQDTLLQLTSGVNSAGRIDNYIFAATVSGNVSIIALDSLPHKIYEINTYVPSNPVKHIEIKGAAGYFIENITGLEIVNLENPEQPVRYSTFHSPGSSNDIKIADNLAYIADGLTGISVISISNPAQPYYIKSVSIETDIRYIDYSPNYLFTGEFSDGISVFNVFDTSTPDFLGYYIPVEKCYGVHFFKAKILVANGANGLLITRF